MKIAIGSDHAGFGLKQRLIEYLTELGINPDDKGTYSIESTDYPPFAHAVSTSVENNDVDFGILICGSANGVAMTANKHAGVRCAICWNSELAKLARAHNDANILAIPARFVTDEEAIEMVDSFLHEKFEGGRHQRRVDQIPC